jgi:DNA invertase Pin-like site-specific DNA recombinase
MEKVVLYLRVSTEKQDEENQKLQLEEYCKKSKLEISNIYIDKISGKNENRKALNELFKDAHKKLFDVVLVWALDRFSRAGILHTLLKLKELENLGIKFHSYTQPHLSSMGFGRDLYIAFISDFAKIEAENISIRTKAGLQRAKKEGKTLGRPKVKFNIELLEELRLKGLSYREIAKELGVSYVTVYNYVKKTNI